MYDEELIPTNLDPEDPGGTEEMENAKKGTGAFVDVKKGEEMLHKFEIISLPVRIGRKPDNDIVLEDKNVSRYHAQIIDREGAFTIEDLGSTGGILVNGDKVGEKDIHTGDRISIGQYVLSFDSGIPEDERTVFEGDDATALDDGTVVDEDRTVYYEEPSARLRVLRAEGLEDEISLEQSMVLGRDEDADLHVDDKRLSRKHCRFELKGEKYTLTDLGSANGTYVNGSKITEIELHDKDKIQAGSCQFEFKLDKVAVPVKRPGNLKVLFRAAVGIGLLAGAVYLAYLFIPRSGGKAGGQMMQKLWTHDTAGNVTSSPALGDLNGDGYVDMVAADSQGAIYALDGRQGGLIWNSAFRSGSAVTASPLVVDINEKDGDLDVLAATSTRGMLAIDGSTMRQIWRATATGAATSPAAADINADGTADILIAEKSGKVLCFDGRQGGLVWSFDSGSAIDASVVLADVNADGTDDAVIGCSNGRVYALNGMNGDILWVYADTETPSTAAVADFNRDRIPDVAIAFPSRVIAVNGRNNSVLWSWNIPEAARPRNADPFLPSPPAVADLNRDGTPDVVVSTPGGHVYAVDGKSEGRKYLWDYGVGKARKSGPALGDLNGDGIPDIVVGDMDGELLIIDGETGQRINALQVGGAISSSPVVGDFTGDGRVDIAAGTAGAGIVAVETQARVRKNRILWDSYGGNVKNTGVISR